MNAEANPVPLVFLVDDQPEMRRLLRMTLRSAAVELLEFGEAGSALAQALERKPALVILDVMMPGPIDGIQMLQTMRATPALADVKVIMLSARAQSADIELGRASGADAYMTKPFSPVELMRTALRLLGEAAPGSGPAAA